MTARNRYLPANAQLVQAGAQGVAGGH